MTDCQLCRIMRKAGLRDKCPDHRTPRCHRSLTRLQDSEHYFLTSHFACGRCRKMFISQQEYNHHVPGGNDCHENNLRVGF